MSYQYIQTYAGGHFRGPNGKSYPFVNTPDDRDKRRARALMEAENRDYKPPTYAERQAIRRAESNARQDVRNAEKIAAREAAKDAPPTNPWTARCREIASRQHLPENRRRLTRYRELERDWDAGRETREAEAKHMAAVAADPQVRTARDWCENWERTAPPEFRVEVAAVKAFANASADGAASWERISALREKIIAAEDAAVAQKMADAGVSRGAFSDAAAKAEAERQRFDAAKPKPESGEAAK